MLSSVVKTTRYFGTKSVLKKIKTEYPVNQVLDVYGYDFHDAENADGISESSYKNGIYSLAWNVTEFVKV